MSATQLPGITTRIVPDIGQWETWNARSVGMAPPCEETDGSACLDRGG